MKKANICESDNNIMVGFKTSDGYIIESVYSKSSGCLCISTQIGCLTQCQFCASGSKKFIRNLSYEELIEQIRYFEACGRKINQIHFGGIGEPLRNLDNINRLTLQFEKYSFQVTTSVPSKELFIKLSGGRYDSIIVSLHSAVEHTRKKLIKHSISVKSIEEAINEYAVFDKEFVNKLRISYLILSDVNTSKEECDSMLLFVKRTKAKLLLLGYNPVPGSIYYTRNQDYLCIVEKCIQEQIYVEDCVNSKSRRDKIGGCGTFAYSTVNK